MKIKRLKLETEFGFIMYNYQKPCEEYPNGLLLFMGSYTNVKYRGEGKFKEMVKKLFSKFPENTLVQVPLSNKVLVPMFERLKFISVDRIEYWGECNNAVRMQGVLYKGICDEI